MSNLRRWLIAYAITFVVFSVIDGAWIALVALGVYQAELAPLLASQPNAVAAACFYLGYVAGVVQFGVQPLNPAPTIRRRAGSGALFGLFTYGTWALTALTLLAGFSAFVAVTDIAWGMALGGLVTTITTWLLQRLRVLAGAGG